MSSFPDANDVLRDAGADALRRQLDMNRRPYIGLQNGRSTANSRTLPIIRRDAGQLSHIATEAERHLIAAGVPFFQRAGKLVRPITCTVPASNERKAKTAALRNVTVGYMRDQMGQHVEWQRYRRREQDWIPTDAPKDVAEIIVERAGDWKFPPVQGILTTPTLRPDGTILAEGGYDPQTQLLLIAPPILPPIPEYPSRSDGLKALSVLDDLLEEFPFVDEPSRSVALSAIITPVVRPAFSNAPIHVAGAPTPATGKSFLMDVASAVAVGQPCHVIAAGRDEAETEKRLVACVLAGYPLVSVDNVNGELGGDFLCQLAERPLLSPRILGRSEQPIIPNRMTVFATGNNIRLKGDFVRRAVTCRLDAKAERPELRRFKSNPVEKVLANRAHYVAAVLIVVRSYFAAGKPVKPPPFGSYTGWSESVRGALLWLGRADPVDTLAAARSEDPELQTLNAVLGAWAQAIGTGRGSACTAAQALSRQIDHLREAIELTGACNKKSPTRALGNWLASVKGRIVDGRSFARLSDNTHGHAALWFIEQVA